MNQLSLFCPVYWRPIIHWSITIVTLTHGNNLWKVLSYLLGSNFVKTAPEAFLFSDFTRISTMKRKSVSSTSLLGLCFPFVYCFNLDVNLCYGCSSRIWKSFSRHIAALLISARFCSLPGLTLPTQHVSWRRALLQPGLPQRSIPDPGAPGNVPGSYVTHSNAQRVTSPISPAWLISLLSGRHLGPTFIFKVLSLLCPLHQPLLSLLCHHHQGQNPL